MVLGIPKPAFLPGAAVAGAGPVPGSGSWGFPRSRLTWAGSERPLPWPWVVKPNHVQSQQPTLWPDLPGSLCCTAQLQLLPVPRMQPLTCAFRLCSQFCPSSAQKVLPAVPGQRQCMGLRVLQPWHRICHCQQAPWVSQGPVCALASTTQMSGMFCGEAGKRVIRSLDSFNAFFPLLFALFCAVLWVWPVARVCEQACDEPGVMELLSTVKVLSWCEPEIPISSCTALPGSGCGERPCRVQDRGS